VRPLAGAQRYVGEAGLFEKVDGFLMLQRGVSYLVSRRYEPPVFLARMLGILREQPMENAQCRQR
jgi:hypothetical protein